MFIGNAWVLQTGIHDIRGSFLHPDDDGTLRPPVPFARPPEGHGHGGGEAAGVMGEMCEVCERAINSILHKLRDTETPVHRVSDHENVPRRLLSRGIHCLASQGHTDQAVAQGGRCHRPVCLENTARRAGSHVPSRQRWPNLFMVRPAAVPPSGRRLQLPLRGRPLHSE